jgi:hypothetical protein
MGPEPLVLEAERAIPVKEPLVPPEIVWLWCAAVPETV